MLEGWVDWTAGVPEEVTSCGRIVRCPPLPEVPEPLRGNALALVEAVFLGGAAAADELLAPLRALGHVMDTLRVMPARELSTLHMDPPMPFRDSATGTCFGPRMPRPWL